MKLRKHLAPLVFFFALVSPAEAVVTYDSDAFSRFELISSGGMGISISTPPEAPTVVTTGTGLASIDADLQTELTPDVLYTITSDVSGSAAAPSGFSGATVLNGLFVELDNTASATPSMAIFSFSYAWFAEVTRTDPLFESGVASPFFHLTGFAPSGGETLMIDDGLGGGAVPMADWLVHPAVMLPLGGVDLLITDTGSATVTAFVTVPAMDSDEFSVITDSSGNALHAAPEPASIILLLTGVVGLGMVKRRRV